MVGWHGRIRHTDAHAVVNAAKDKAATSVVSQRCDFDGEIPRCWRESGGRHAAVLPIGIIQVTAIAYDLERAIFNRQPCVERLLCYERAIREYPALTVVRSFKEHLDISLVIDNESASIGIDLCIIIDTIVEPKGAWVEIHKCGCGHFDWEVP